MKKLEQNENKTKTEAAYQLPLFQKPLQLREKDQQTADQDGIETDDTDNTQKLEGRDFGGIGAEVGRDQRKL